jgi:hypothetical protein
MKKIVYIIWLAILVIASCEPTNEVEKQEELDVEIFENEIIDGLSSRRNGTSVPDPSPQMAELPPKSWSKI